MHLQSHLMTLGLNHMQISRILDALCDDDIDALSLCKSSDQVINYLVSQSTNSYKEKYWLKLFSIERVKNKCEELLCTKMKNLGMDEHVISQILDEITEHKLQLFLRDDVTECDIIKNFNNWSSTLQGFEYWQEKMLEAFIKERNAITEPETEIFDFSKPLQTKSGSPLRILATDAPGNFPVVAMDDSGRIIKYALDGHGTNDEGDRLMYAEQRTVTYMSVPRLSNVFEYIGMCADKPSTYSSKFSAHIDSLEFLGPLISVIKLEYVNGVLQGASLVQTHE